MVTSGPYKRPGSPHMWIKLPTRTHAVRAAGASARYIPGSHTWPPGMITSRSGYLSSGKRSIHCLGSQEDMTLIGFFHSDGIAIAHLAPRSITEPIGLFSRDRQEELIELVPTRGPQHVTIATKTTRPK